MAAPLTPAQIVTQYDERLRAALTPGPGAKKYNLCNLVANRSALEAIIRVGEQLCAISSKELAITARQAQFRALVDIWDKSPEKRIYLADAVPHRPPAYNPAARAAAAAQPKKTKGEFERAILGLFSLDDNDARRAQASGLYSELIGSGVKVGDDFISSLEQLQGTPVSAPQGIGAPIPIKNDGRVNCFLSSIMWALLLNDPFFSTQAQEKIARLELELATLEDRIIRLGDQTLQEKYGTVQTSYVCLVELKEFIDRCQNSKGPIRGWEIGQIRNILNRLKPESFGDASSRRQEDASEVLNTLTDLIFDGSNWNQLISKTMALQVGAGQRPPAGYESLGVNGAVKKINNSSDTKWGSFMVQVLPGKSVKDHLRADFFATSDPANPSIEPYKVNGVSYPVVRMTTRMNFAPQVLVVNLKRTLIRFDPKTKAPVYDKVKAPIAAEKRLTLEKDFFVNDADTEYELIGVVDHLGDSADGGHFIAEFQAPNGAFFRGDDIGNPPVRGSDERGLLNAGRTGYILVYRKK